MGLNEAQKKERSEYLEKNLEITECSQKKPYVFVSYASDNWETVFKRAVVPLQKQYGLQVYADKAFDKVNDKWIVPMLRNVRGADVVVAFVSQSYIESYACFLELLTAVNNKKQVVFVSLEEKLHLGDTTDQPIIERGVKNEILNQGANIATNTNNTSNDIMRAMKSAYTSISTLLEQDALSRYDISDAFINFFRDASINRKTINDLKAVRGTISSISKRVFNKSLAAVTEPKAVSWAVPEPAGNEAKQESGAEQALRQKTSAVPEPEQYTFEAPPVSEARPVPDRKPDKSYKQNSRLIKIAIAGGIGLLALIIIFSIAAGGKKHVKDVTYTVIGGYTGTYTGEWDDNMPNGQGRIEFGNGDVYEGSFVDGRLSGQGTCKWANGDVYEGNWENSDMNGTGIYKFISGRCEEGTFVNGYLNGQGTCRFENNDVYEGNWDNGVMSGQGVYTWANGDVFEGNFVNDMKEGPGILTFIDKRVFEGVWKEDKANGPGTLTQADGTVLTGTWENDEYVG